MQSATKLKLVIIASLLPWFILLFFFALALSVRDQDNFASIGAFLIGLMFFGVALFLSIMPGLIFSIVELKKNKSKLAIAATVLGIVNLVVLIVFLVMVRF